MPYVFRQGFHPITDGGFPHSEISGSKLTYSSPKHIGVSTVLHRLLVPRHPPCALSNLTCSADDKLHISSSSQSSASSRIQNIRSGASSIDSSTCSLLITLTVFKLLFIYKRENLKWRLLGNVFFITLSSFQRTKRRDYTLKTERTKSVTSCIYSLERR